MKIAIICLIFSLTSLNCINVSPISIIIDKEIDGDHSQIASDTLHAVEIYCQQRQIDCDKFGNDLTIHIRKNSSHLGIYKFPAQIIELAYRDGQFFDALFHESLHHESMTWLNLSLHHSSPEKAVEFFGIVSQVTEAWCVDAGKIVLSWYDESEARHIVCR